MIWYDMIWYDMIWYDMIWYDMIYLLTAIGLKPGGSSTAHIYTQTTHRITQLTRRTTQLTTRTIQLTTSLGRVRQCPDFVVYNAGNEQHIKKIFTVLTSPLFWGSDILINSQTLSTCPSLKGFAHVSHPHTKNVLHYVVEYLNEDLRRACKDFDMNRSQQS
jgi:hypothetical protein